MRTEARKIEINDLGKALQVLDDAAQKSSDEVQRMIRSDYKHLKKTFEEITPEIRTALSAVSNSATEAVRNTAESVSTYAKDTAKEVDHHAKENPWLYAGGSAIAGGLVGYFLARRN